MSRYRLEFRPAAMRSLRRLDPQVARRIHGVLAMLAQDPRPPGARQLRGRPGLRVRVGDNRIIYTINGDIVLVVLVTVGHRSAVYRE